MNYRLGFDIGGTKIEATIIDKNMNTIASIRAPTERDLGYNVILDNIKSLCTSILHDNGLKLENIESIGLALPGTVDQKHQVMAIGNTRILENKKISLDLARHLNFKNLIKIENDANCFAWAEYKLNNLAGSVLGIILGTGVGGGLIIDGKIYDGARGSAGEIGHLSLFEAQKPCYCGQIGCAEQFLSGLGLENDFYMRTSKKLSSYEILNIKEEQELYCKKLAKLIGTVINIVDVDCIILGGGISKQSFIYKNINQEIKKYLFFKNNAPTVISHKISDSSGSIGAALL